MLQAGAETAAAILREYVNRRGHLLAACCISVYTVRKRALRGEACFQWSAGVNSGLCAVVEGASPKHDRSCCLFLPLQDFGRVNMFSLMSSSADVW